MQVLMFKYQYTVQGADDLCYHRLGNTARHNAWTGKLDKWTRAAVCS